MFQYYQVYQHFSASVHFIERIPDLSLIQAQSENDYSHRSWLRSSCVLRQAISLLTLLPSFRPPSMDQVFGLPRYNFECRHVRSRHDRLRLPVPPSPSSDLDRSRPIFPMPQTIHHGWLRPRSLQRFQRSVFASSAAPGRMATPLASAQETWNSWGLSDRVVVGYKQSSP